MRGNLVSKHRSRPGKPVVKAGSYLEVFDHGYAGFSMCPSLCRLVPLSSRKATRLVAGTEGGNEAWSSFCAA